MHNIICVLALYCNMGALSKDQKSFFNLSYNVHVHNSFFLYNTRVRCKRFGGYIFHAQCSAIHKVIAKMLFIETMTPKSNQRKTFTMKNVSQQLADLTIFSNYYSMIYSSLSYSFINCCCQPSKQQVYVQHVCIAIVEVVFRILKN